MRVVATRAHARGVTRIVENPQGLVMAAAGVDSSNAPDGVVLLLPEDPDASARALCAAVTSGRRGRGRAHRHLGRPWRGRGRPMPRSGQRVCGCWTICAGRPMHPVARSMSPHLRSP
ncbi:MAG: coenzyme F420-0:L-glutamate ligase [Schumannella sp.]